METLHCRRCGGQVVKKPLARLILVGLIFIATIGLAVIRPIILIPAILAALIGIYLLVWAVVYRGRWCRESKRFDGV
jgi:Flp pilus assembly protein TadB